MTYIDDNIGLIRSNTISTDFDSGNINENNILPYSNLFYSYILDNADNNQNISLNIDVINQNEINYDKKSFPNKNWVKNNRYCGNLIENTETWGFLETSHALKKSKSISNAFVLGGQKITFYTATRGHKTGYVDNEWLYCKTSMTISAIDIINNSNTILYNFDDFSCNLDDSRRYFSFIIPENNSYGEAVCEHLTKDTSSFKYNLYYDYKKFKYGDNKKIVYGLCTNATTRPLMIDSLYNYVFENTHIIKSKGLALELIGLEQNIRERIEAGNGEKDDLCLATSFCTYVRSYEPAIKSRFGSKTFANETSSEVLLLNEDTPQSNFNFELQKINSFNKQKFEDDEEERKIILKQKNIALKRTLKKAIDEKDININLAEIVYGNTDSLDDGDFLFFDDGSQNKNINNDVDPDLDL